MNARIMAAQIALARINPTGPRALAAVHSDGRAIRVAAALAGEAGPHQEPMPPIGSDIPIKASPAGHGSNKQINGAIAIKVAAGEPASDHGFPTEGRIFVGDVLEAARAVVSQQLIALAIGPPKR